MFVYEWVPLCLLGITTLFLVSSVSRTIVPLVLVTINPHPRVSCPKSNHCSLPFRSLFLIVVNIVSYL